MRVTKIKIKNFRAFYETLEIDLHKAGKNLLVYGENGSGKSSLYLALKLFLESSDDTSTQFEDHQNIFIEDEAHIKLHLRTNPWANEHVYEWSRTTRETEDQRIIAASKATGFLDYKALLETHNVSHDEEDVNVFMLLIDNLLANTIGDVKPIEVLPTTGMTYNRHHILAETQPHRLQNWKNRLNYSITS